ncbi:MAG: hypothetical protein ACLS6O_07335 [Bifidobacterium sp.]
MGATATISTRPAAITSLGDRRCALPRHNIFASLFTPTGNTGRPSDEYSIYLIGKPSWRPAAGACQETVTGDSAVPGVSPNGGACVDRNSMMKRDYNRAS